MPIGTGRVAEPAGSGGSTGLERLLARVLAAPRLVVPACPGNAGPVGLPDRSAQCIRLIRRRVLSGRESHSLTRGDTGDGTDGERGAAEATFSAPHIADQTIAQQLRTATPLEGPGGRRTLGPCVSWRPGRHGRLERPAGRFQLWPAGPPQREKPEQPPSPMRGS